MVIALVSRRRPSLPTILLRYEYSGAYFSHLLGRLQCFHHCTRYHLQKQVLKNEMVE